MDLRSIDVKELRCVSMNLNNKTMKKIILPFILLLFVLLNVQTAEAQEDALQKFANILKQGNAHALLPNLSEQVEININGVRQSVSNAQSEAILGDFMRKHPLTNFEFKHQGSSGQSGYAVGKYTDKEGKHFRMIIKTNGQKIEKIDLTAE